MEFLCTKWTFLEWTEYFYTNTVHGGMVWLTKEIFFKIFRKWDSEYYLNFEPFRHLPVAAAAAAGQEWARSKADFE